MDGMEKVSEVLVSKALAAVPKGEAKLCLIAGNMGHVVGGVCKADNGSSILSADKKTLTCGADTFGPGVTIPRPRDSRWTMACANQVIASAGIKGKTIDQELSEDEIFLLGKFLRETQGVSFKNNIFKSVLSKCDQIVGRDQDKKDCDRLNTVFWKSLQTYAPVKTGKYQDCWKEWVKTGARITTSKAVAVDGQFDSLILMNWFGGCSLKPQSGSKAGSNCSLKKGTRIQMLGPKNGVASKIQVKASVVCTMPNGQADVVLADQSLLLDCDDGGISDLPFRMSRMMNRNFSLDPACKCDLRTTSEKNAEHYQDWGKYDAQKGF
jgi:hypothetical protein